MPTAAPAAETTTSGTPPPVSETYNPFDIDSIMAANGYGPEDEPAPAEPVPEETAAEVVVPPPPPEKPKHSKLATRLAKESGLTQAEIDVLDADELDDEVYSRTVNLKFKAAAATPEPPPAEEPEFGGLDMSGFDPDLVAVLRSQAKELKELKAREKQQTQTHQMAQATTFAEKMDALFAGNEAAFGKGPSGRVNPQTREGARRAAVIGHLSGLLARKKATTLDADFKAACDLLGFDAQTAQAGADKAAADAADKDKAAKWAKAGLARPTDRKGEEQPKGEERAAVKIRELFNRASSEGRAVNGEASIDDFLK